MVIVGVDAFVVDFDEEAAVDFVFFSDFSEVFTVFLELVPVIIFSLADSFLVISTAFEGSVILVSDCASADVSKVVGSLVAAKLPFCSAGSSIPFPFLLSPKLMSMLVTTSFFSGIVVVNL